MHGSPVPDPRVNAAQKEIVDAQRELEAIKMSQQTRSEKANKAINFILLPYQGKDGLMRLDAEDTPECRNARRAAYKFLEDYFNTTTDFEDGLAVRERTALGTQLTAV